jgi:hypothetical protein
MRIGMLSRTSILACTGGLLIATAAMAGSGVGGLFNLGQMNTVNATTQLRGIIAGQQLSVLNTSSNANAVAVSVGCWHGRLRNH